MKTTKQFLFVLISCVAQLIPVYCGGNELLDSWRKISANYANDVQQSNKVLYKIKEEQRILAELRTIVERHLRTKTAEILSNALSSHSSGAADNKLQDILQGFEDDYDNQMIDAIFFETIEELIHTVEVRELPQLMWSIYQQNCSRSFEIMLRAQVQLYNIIRKTSIQNEKEFVRLFANKLHKIKQEPLYKAIDLSLKLKVQQIIEKLPDSLKYLYFMPYFCLQNSQYSTYIYTAISAKIDPLSRYIWLWQDTRTMDDTGFIKAEVSDLKGEENAKLYVALKGTKYNMYYYMMPNTMKIAGWDSTDEPLHNIWEIEFWDNDRVVFTQNDYLMCATENQDNERRNVAGRKSGDVSSRAQECQWRLGQCNFG